MPSDGVGQEGARVEQVEEPGQRQVVAEGLLDVDRVGLGPRPRLEGRHRQRQRPEVGGAHVDVLALGERQRGGEEGDGDEELAAMGEWDLPRP